MFAQDVTPVTAPLSQAFQITNPLFYSLILTL